MGGLAAMLVAACLTSCARCGPPEGACRPADAAAAPVHGGGVDRLQFAPGRVWKDVATDIVNRLSGPKVADSVEIVDECGGSVAVVRRSQVNWADDFPSVVNRNAFLGVILAAAGDPTRVEIRYGVGRFTESERRAVVAWSEVAAHVRRTVDTQSQRSGRPPRSVRLVLPDHRTSATLPTAFWLSALRTLTELERLGVVVAEVELWVDG